MNSLRETISTCRESTIVPANWVPVLATSSLGFYIEYVGWLGWLSFGKCKNAALQESRATNHLLSPHRSPLHCATTAQPPKLLPLLELLLLWLLDSTRRLRARKANWKMLHDSVSKSVYQVWNTHLELAFEAASSDTHLISRWRGHLASFPRHIGTLSYGEDNSWRQY